MEKKMNSILKNFFDEMKYSEIISAMDSSDAKIILDINNKTSKMMSNYSRHISYTQFRTIHQEIKKQKQLVDLAKLLPKLAYIEARQDKNDAKELIRFIRELASELIKINEESNITPFHNYLDALVAYHKLHSKN